MESNNEQLISLPEFWYVQRNYDNSKILNDWNNKKYNCNETNKAWSSHNAAAMLSDTNYTAISVVNKSKYKEITFEQFKMWVLNKSKIYELW
jgi:hypothetical protein